MSCCILLFWATRVLFIEAFSPANPPGGSLQTLVAAVGVGPTVAEPRYTDCSVGSEFLLTLSSFAIFRTVVYLKLTEDEIVLTVYQASSLSPSLCSVPQLNVYLAISFFNTYVEGMLP